MHRALQTRFATSLVRNQANSGIAELVPPPVGVGARSVSLDQLMRANLHIGHAAKDWSHRMLPFIYGERHGVHIINLDHTLVHLRRAANVARQIALDGGNIVFLGTKPMLHRIVIDAAARADQYYILHWIGGTISNKHRVLRRSVGFDPDKVAQVNVCNVGDCTNSAGRSRTKGHFFKENTRWSTEPRDRRRTV